MQRIDPFSWLTCRLVFRISTEWFLQVKATQITLFPVLYIFIGWHGFILSFLTFSLISSLCAGNLLSQWCGWLPLECSIPVFSWLNLPTVVEVNPLCGQRRSLLAQIGSSNNCITLRRRFLITINQLAKKAYLKSNVVVRREDGAPVSLF